MIPGFNISGVIPPFVGLSPTARATMSPYATTMLEFAEYFSSSVERLDLLEGLVAYRRALRASGICDGFQWIDGSFVEKVEARLQRAPGDIDVVTFAQLPCDRTQAGMFLQDNAHLFHPSLSKRDFKCDAYFVDLGKRPTLIVDDTRYWFGLFSHQRDTSLWKGMIQIGIGLTDGEAEAFLQEKRPALLPGTGESRC
ncbi:DUF6932 family protein [Bordetella genomosp. 1]|uniref:DUF6932 family protein n=1 Tax=Bordetella genomosp. 1 TaxID=1395607 RepID=UPI0015951027|nr:hypothetical protein [Bordetella genomosp. 1]MDQ8032469.1 hypothetical protein [Bordetella sp.]